MNSSDFDQRFDAGESVIEALDLGGARRIRLEQRTSACAQSSDS